MSRAGNRERQLRFLDGIRRPDRRLSEIDEGKNLVQSGPIDPLALLEIVSFLESEFGVQRGSRLLDSILLELGIFVSMLRERRRRGGSAPPRGVWPALGRIRAVAEVWLFYSLIRVWSVEPVSLGFSQRTRFFLSLWGLT